LAGKDRLYSVVSDRRNNPREGSYTNYLLEKGLDKTLKKVGEEAAEVIIGAKNPGKQETVYEIADLLYHITVLMLQKGIEYHEVYSELVSRHVKDR
jgi:phosphoribosyl-ATP pyrophosphohydrolase/phosphoribosyl-AMP cyclohydrolase